ncbi:hypothetical protein D3C86_1660860 [compost metagenome]
MIQGLGRTRLGGLLRHRFERVEQVLDHLQLLAIAGAEVLAAGGFGDGFQGRLVEVQARVDPEKTECATVLRIGTDADGVDFHPFECRQPRRRQRGDFAAVIGAVGDQNQHATLRRAHAQPLQGQANGIADRGVFAGDADARFVEPDPHGAPVEGQRCLQVRLAAKQDQADPVAFATFEEVAE